MPFTLDLLIKYFQGWQWTALFAAVFVYTLLRAKKENKIYLITGAALFFVFIYNDLIYKIMSGAGVVEAGVYYRFLWIVPFTIWIAYGLVRIFLDLKKWWLRIPFFIIMCVLMLTMDHTWIEKDRATWTRPENAYLIPNEVIAVSEALGQEHEAGEKIRCVMPSGMTMQLRCIDPAVECVIPRRDFLKMSGQENKKYKQKELLFFIEKNEDPKDLKKLLQKADCDFVIAYTAFEQGDRLEASGCEFITGTGNYEIYRVLK